MNIWGTSYIGNMMSMTQLKIIMCGLQNNIYNTCL